MSGMVTAAGATALLGIVGAIASLAYLHLASTGLSPLRDAVSHHGITRQRAGYRAATISLAVAGAALAVGIGTALNGEGRAVIVLLVLFALARLAISWFPMDAPRVARTATRQFHGLLAVVAFGAVTAAAFRLGTLLDGGVRWHNLGPVSSGVAWVMLACLAAMFMIRLDPRSRGYFGAVARAFYLGMIGWISLFAVACLARPA